MIRIAVLSPHSIDPNSFWRCIGPLSYLQKSTGHEIQIDDISAKPALAWCDFAKYDLLFLHRPCRHDDMTVMQIAYNLNIPVWVDFDDYLFDLPWWNPQREYYGNPGTQTFVARALACADVVSVSTAELYNQFKVVNENVVIVPNAYRSDLLPYRGEELRKRQNVGYWRGSATHDGDLLSVPSGFKGLKGKLNFIGSASWMFFTQLEAGSYHHLGNTDPIGLFRTVYDMDPKVCVFPLHNCLFNRCKSNIAYIEAMHAGALCVGPDLPEWRREGVITYEPSNPDSFRDAVNTAFDMPEEEHQKVLKSAFKNMKDLYDITVVNEIRKNIVSSMLSPSFKKNKYSPFDEPLGLHALGILKGLTNKNGQKNQG